MPVLNEGGRIGRAISSLADQTYPVSKLVVVDGGSTDSTHEEVHAMAEETDFEIDLRVIEGAGVRYSSQFGAETAAEHIFESAGSEDGVVLRLEGDSALEETFVETAVETLDEESYTVFGGPVTPHDPMENPVMKRFFTFFQNAEKLPKGRAMAFRASDFAAVDGYRMNPQEDIRTSDVSCFEDGILVSKLQERGEVAFSYETCVYSSVPSTSATSPSRWVTAAKIEREMGPTHYFTRIASPVNKLLYAGERVVQSLSGERRYADPNYRRNS
jgi:cellulose synthase/poly-beta-1,6-N-acetylglucosamine synthase-like glycosyltransferase